MGRNNYFQFKQFRVIQEKAAMKVNTDGVLLGAWVDVQNKSSILDVGTGTGLVALMLAQRTTGQITGIEIEENAAIEAAENCKNSPWTNRISIKHISFQDYVETSKGKFDLIVSNPPFFINDKRPQNQNLALARHAHLLPVEDIVFGVKKLLLQNGTLAVIYPATAAKKLIELAYENDLYLHRLTEVKPTPLKETNRYLMEFCPAEKTTEKNSLSVFDESGKNFSKSYIELTKEFYLNF